MPRQIRPPPPPPFPDKLPFEDAIDRALNRLADSVERSPLLRRLQEFHARLPVILEGDLPTPMGRLKTPELALPRPALPQMDARRKDAFKAAILDDISALVENIPVLGFFAHPLADMLEDVAMAKVHASLTPQEYEEFKKRDKFWPLTALSMVDALSRRPHRD